MNRAQLIQENSELRQENKFLREELTQLKRLIYGQKRERYVAEVIANQLSLFSGEEISVAEPVVDTQHIEYDRKTPRKNPGRTVLPDHLPV